MTLNERFYRKTLMEFRDALNQIDKKAMEREVPRCLLLWIQDTIIRAGKALEQMPAANWKGIASIVDQLHQAICDFRGLDCKLERL